MLSRSHPTKQARSRSSPGHAHFSRWPFSSFQLIRARRIWDKASNKRRIVVAVIDDGFDLNHPAFRDRLWQMPCRAGVHGWNFVDDSDDVAPAPDAPVSSHGTMVAGIIGGLPDGQGAFAGVAPNAELMLLRWRSSSPPQAHANPVNMAAALRFAVNNGARIVNLSASIDATGKSARALSELRSAFEWAEKQHVLVVVAAPNLPDNLDADTAYLPGVYPFTNLIHVTGFCRELRLLGSWGARSVDLAAPAEDITGPMVGGGYRRGSATSFAAPLVTGALALVWGLLPKLKADHVRHLVLRNAKPMGCQDGFSNGTNVASLKRSASLKVPRLQSHEVWGHEFPGTAEGRLNLGFLEKAWQEYWSGTVTQPDPW